MVAEGFEPSILDGPPPSANSGGGGGVMPPSDIIVDQEAAVPTLKEDPKYSKYFKMMTMHLPKEAVVQKMVAEGLDVSILDKVVQIYLHVS